MFKLAQTATYWWPVTLSRASATKPGEFEPAGTVEVEFKRLPEDELDALRAAPMRTDREFAAAVVVGVRKIADADGNELPAGPGHVPALLNQPGVGTQLVTAFFASRSAAAQKN